MFWFQNISKTEWKLLHFEENGSFFSNMQSGDFSRWLQWVKNCRQAFVAYKFLLRSIFRRNDLVKCSWRWVQHCISWRIGFSSNVNSRWKSKWINRIRISDLLGKVVSFFWTNIFYFFDCWQLHSTQARNFLLWGTPMAQGANGKF